MTIDEAIKVLENEEEIPYDDYIGNEELIQFFYKLWEKDFVNQDGANTIKPTEYIHYCDWSKFK